MKKQLVTFYFVLLSFFAVSSAQSDWQKIATVHDVCSAYPEQMKSVFTNLNLDYPGLEATKAGWESGKLEVACDELLKYYRNPEKNKSAANEQPEFSALRKASCDSVLRDIYTFQQVSGKVPRLENGHLKWDHMGHENDIEWAWALNRHYPISTILPYFQATGNTEYGKYIDRFVKDWIIESWPYPAKKSSTAMWRGLEVSFREKVWAQVFYGLMNTGAISPATQLLILSVLPDHAHYARNFHAQGNWLTMEMSGLATVAAYWPEYKQSDEWLKYSIGTMTESLKEQVYPDGVQTELTSSYHIVALYNFALFADICEKAGIEMPGFYSETLEKMYNYLAYSIRPDGNGLLNNDADLVNNTEKLIKAAEKYGRDDWKYIVTNGKEGKKPSAGPSYLFPWAGHLISRSDFDENAQWSFFDMGPWGSGHQHSDKLHLSVAAFGHDFLVDGGRFAYRGETADKFRKYATGSFSHNVILIDGKGQSPGPKQVTEPLPDSDYRIDPIYDYGTASFDQFGDAEDVKHTRTLVYIRGEFWVVIDKISCTSPHKIETLWHWNPKCKVEKQNNGIVAGQIDGKSLEIIPVGKSDWTTEVIKGQDEPTIQGWYSREYNVYEPNVASVYSTEIKSDQTFVWLLYPTANQSIVPEAKIVSKPNELITLKVTIPGKGDCLISFNEGERGQAVEVFKSF